MTTICGYHDPQTGDVWLAADTRITSKGFIFPTGTRSKIYNSGRWYFAVSGSVSFDRAVDKAKVDLLAAEDIAAFVDAIMAALKTLDWKPDEAEAGPRCHEITMLVSDGDELWTVYGSGASATHADGFHAIGSGQDFAWGAWHVIKTVNNYETLVPSQALADAINAAAAYDASTGGEINIINVSECLRAQTT